MKNDLKAVLFLINNVSCSNTNIEKYTTNAHPNKVNKNSDVELYVAVDSIYTLYMYK